MRTLRHKFLLAVLSLVLVCQAVTVVTVLWQARDDAERRAVQNLLVTSGVLRSYLTSRHQQLANTVDVLARDFAFRQAVASEDVATLRSALRNHASRVHADFAMIYANSGELLAATSDDAVMLAGTHQRSSDRHLGEIVVSDSGEVFQTVSVPVRAPLKIGTASMGFSVDDALAMQLKGVTGDDVSFVVLRGGSAGIAASTLDPVHREQLAESMIRSTGRDLAVPEYFVRSERLASDGVPVYAVLLRARHDAMAAYDALVRWMLLLAALCASIAIVTATRLSGSLTRPLAALVGAARRIRDGDYSSPVEVVASDEIGELARTVDSMQAEIAQREREVQHRATHDALTGLPNRDAATAELARRIAMGEAVSAFVVAFDGLHDINSSLGLEVGDSMLLAIVQRLRSHVHDGAYVARLSDERFVIVAKPDEPAERRATTLHDLFETPLSSDMPANLRVAVGVAGAPRHARDAEGLVRCAWIASMQAAAAPGGTMVYDAERDAEQTRRLKLIEDLRGAIDGNELSVVYQPQYRVRSGCVGAAEALVRWRHPVLGNISPAEFIPLAERSGTIRRLTRWVFAEVCAQQARWRAENLDIVVAVNLSANDLVDAGFPGFVMSTLARFGVSPRAIEFEVTETALAEDPERMLGSLRVLRGLQFMIAIDDFGTGFSSLAQLKRLPIGVLKIDRSFVRDLENAPDDSLIVQSTIELAHGLGLAIVAEGVETEGAAGLLAKWGAETLQGYLLSPPLAAEAFASWLSNADFTSLRSATSAPLPRLGVAR